MGDLWKFDPINGIKYICRSNMGSSHFAIPQKMNQEWVQTEKNGHKVILNTITHQIFRLHKIGKQLIATPNHYIQRSIHSIPHTPRTIILDDTTSFLYVLVQQPLSHIKFLVKKKSFLFQVLEVLRDMIDVVWQLKRKYGSFEVREDMMGIVKNEEIIMWINRRFQAVEVQYSLRNYQNEQESMIKNIIEICQKYSKFDLSFLLAQHAGIVQFDSFMRQITIKMEVQKIKISQNRRQPTSPLSKNEAKTKQINKDSRTNHSQVKDFDKRHRPFVNKHQRHFTINEETDSAKQSKNQAKQYQLLGSFGRKKKISLQQLMVSDNTTSESKLKNDEFVINQIPTINLQGLQRFERSRVSGSRAQSTNKNVTFCLMEHAQRTKKQFQKQNNDRVQRRQSTIRWMEEPEPGEKSIIDDYHCLFSKSGIQLSKKQIHEAFSKPIDEK